MRLRLSAGLRRARVEQGMQPYENRPATGLTREGSGLRVATPGGHIDTDRVIVVTNAWAEPERQIRRYVIAIYDYVLVTEPLTAD